MTEDGESRRERDVLERLARALGFSVWEPSPQFIRPVLRIGLVPRARPFFTLPLSRPVSGARPSLRTMLRTFEKTPAADEGDGERHFEAPGWIPSGNSVDEIELVMAAMGV